MIGRFIEAQNALLSCVDGLDEFRTIWKLEQSQRETIAKLENDGKLGEAAE